MKNIIELAARYFDKIDNADGIEELEYKAEESKMKLQEALSEYKRLSETLITEEWLKEHGMEVIENLGYAGKVIGDKYVEYKPYLNLLRIFSTDNGDLLFIHRNILTIAQLLDAMELCGIKMED